MKWLIGLLTLAALGVAAIWTSGVFTTITVVVAPPERREAVRVISVLGSVRAEQIARIRTEVGGEVVGLFVQQGVEVRDGEPVMELKVEEQKTAVVETQARLREAQMTVQERRLNLDREQELLAQGASTQQAVDDARAAYNRAAAAASSIRAILSARKTVTGKGKVVAPISGVVTQVNVNIGDIVPPNVEAITIIDPASFRVVAEVDELDITRIRPGQEAIVSFDAMPKSRYRARVDRIIPQADEVTKTLPVILRLTDGALNLSEGLTANINIVQERHPNALTIPRRALLDEKGNKARLFILTDRNTLQLDTVLLGVRGEDYVEVLDGITEEARVVLDPDPLWKEGEGVEIDKAATAGRRK